MTTYTKCKECGTQSPNKLYRSGRMALCHDCQHFKNLSLKKTGGGVFFTCEEFRAWRLEPSHQHCRYCGIDSQTLTQLAIVNVRTKRPFEVLGVDRRNNALPYTLANLVPCCAPCNAIKSSILTESEMEILGRSLNQVWMNRLKAVGIKQNLKLTYE